MKFAELCLSRPIAVLLLWLAVVVTGGICWTRLPVAALPSFDMPTIRVNASLSGASPQTMASSVATPLEKNLSTVPGLAMLTSTSLQGATTIVLEFDPSVNIDSAAVDVQSALYQTMKKLPSQMTTPPSFRKVNPADAPIAAIAIDSPSMTLSDLNRFTDNLISPALSTIQGVAEVTVIGQKRYAVRVEVDPDRLAATDLTLTDVQTALKAANANSPIGELDGKRQMMMLQTRGDLMNAADFANVIIATRNGQPVRLADVASVQDSIENTMSYSAVNGQTAIVLNINRQPGANIVSTIDAIQHLLPTLQAQMPPSVKMQLLNDRSLSIRQAIHDVNLTLLLTIALVIMVIMLFLRHIRATLIPALSVPVSLLGAFALMYALGMSLDNISLMGLTIAVGLVVDDAIVVLDVHDSRRNSRRLPEYGFRLRPAEYLLPDRRAAGCGALFPDAGNALCADPVLGNRRLDQHLRHAGNRQSYRCLAPATGVLFSILCGGAGYHIHALVSTRTHALHPSH